MTNQSCQIRSRIDLSVRPAGADTLVSAPCLRSRQSVCVCVCVGGGGRFLAAEPYLLMYIILNMVASDIRAP